MINPNQYAVDHNRRQDQMRQAKKWAQTQIVQQQKDQQVVSTETPRLKNERPQTQTGLYPAVQY